MYNGKVMAVADYAPVAQWIEQPPRKREGVTPTSLIRTYQKEVQRQKQMIKKAEFAQQRRTSSSR